MYSSTSSADAECMDQMQAILTEGSCSRLPSEPAQLLPHVYIGSQHNAESLRLLRRLGITHVLNCAGYKGPRKNPDVSPYEGLDIEYYEFKAEDTDRYDMRQHIPEATSYLNGCLRRGGVCLVHCALGVNRSATICVAYLMQHKQMNLLNAVSLLKRKRPLVLLNKNFQRQLVIYARTHGFNKGTSGYQPRYGNYTSSGILSTDKKSTKDRKKVENSELNSAVQDFLERSRRLRQDVVRPPPLKTYYTQATTRY